MLRIELAHGRRGGARARPHIGYLHRCFEKHAESVDYPGVIPYTDRMDYVASMGNSLGYALAVEKLMGIEVQPVRADHPRDHGRAAAHRLALRSPSAPTGWTSGPSRPSCTCCRDREKILDLFEWTCGARLLYNYNWIGGLSTTCPRAS